MSVEQAFSLAVIGGVAMGIWARWMTQVGDEWWITTWVRKHWQRLAKKVDRFRA